MHPGLRIVASAVALACLAGGCVSVEQGPPMAPGLVPAPGDPLEYDHLWMTSRAEALSEFVGELGDRIEEEELLDAHGRPKVTRSSVIEGVGPFTRTYKEYGDLEMLEMARKLVDFPGPELAGRFDMEMPYWLDIERAGKAIWVGGVRARHYFDANVPGQSKDLGFTQYDATARLETAEDWPMGAFVKIRSLDLTSRPRLPDTGERFPDCLEDVQIGVMGPWMWPPGLLNVTFGSASDKLFASADEMTTDVTWSLGSLGGSDSLFFLVNWQNNREYLNRCPVPGVAYRYKEGDWFTLTAGFPVSAMSWRPVRQVEVSATYEFPRTVHAEAAYRPCDPLQLHAGFSWTNQRFFRHDRPGVRDRLWCVQKEVSAGVRWQLTPGARLDVFGGYAFDRFWFEGERYEDRGSNRVDVSDGPLMGIRLEVAF